MIEKKAVSAKYVSPCKTGAMPYWRWLIPKARRLTRGTTLNSSRVLFSPQLLDRGNTITRWWQLKYFLIFTPIWGRLPFWLIFFKGVETTNQIISISFGWSKVWVAARSVADGPLQARTSQDPWFSMSFLEMRRCLLGRFTLVYILGFFCFIGGWTHHV